jgi:hypothetical protein
MPAAILDRRTCPPCPAASIRADVIVTYDQRMADAALALGLRCVAPA